MTKPTGRPRGRPKTKAYVTLMARVPLDLAEQVQRYAGRKRHTLSEVLRDGLLVLLQEEDPYRASTADTQEDTATHDAVPVLVSDSTAALAHQRPDTHAPHADRLSDTKKPQAVITSDSQEALPDTVSDTMTPFDTAKYGLGTLCPHGHSYASSGHSLRRLTDRECLACQAARARAARQRKRQGTPASLLPRA